MQFYINPQEQQVASLSVDELRAIMIDENSFRSTGIIPDGIAQRTGREICASIGLHYDTTWVEMVMRAANRITAIKAAFPEAEFSSGKFTPA